MDFPRNRQGIFGPLSAWMHTLFLQDFGKRRADAGNDAGSGQFRKWREDPLLQVIRTFGKCRYALPCVRKVLTRLRIFGLLVKRSQRRSIFFLKRSEGHLTHGEGPDCAASRRDATSGHYKREDRRGDVSHPLIANEATERFTVRPLWRNYGAVTSNAICCFFARWRLTDSAPTACSSDVSGPFA